MPPVAGGIISAPAASLPPAATPASAPPAPSGGSAASASPLERASSGGGREAAGWVAAANVGEPLPPPPTPLPKSVAEMAADADKAAALGRPAEDLRAMRAGAAAVAGAPASTAAAVGVGAAAALLGFLLGCWPSAAPPAAGCFPSALGLRPVPRATAVAGAPTAASDPPAAGAEAAGRRLGAAGGLAMPEGGARRPLPAASSAPADVPLPAAPPPLRPPPAPPVPPVPPVPPARVAGSRSRAAPSLYRSPQALHRLARSGTAGTVLPLPPAPAAAGGGGKAQPLRQTGDELRPQFAQLCMQGVKLSCDLWPADV